MMAGNVLSAETTGDFDGKTMFGLFLCCFFNHRNKFMNIRRGASVYFWCLNLSACQIKAFVSNFEKYSSV